MPLFDDKIRADVATPHLVLILLSFKILLQQNLSKNPVIEWTLRNFGDIVFLDTICDTTTSYIDAHQSVKGEFFREHRQKKLSLLLFQKFEMMKTFAQ